MQVDYREDNITCSGGVIVSEWSIFWRVLKDVLTVGEKQMLLQQALYGLVSSG